MKFHATVFLAPVGPESTMVALTAALAPFDLNDYRCQPYDPDAAWDWWRLTPVAELPLKPGRTDDPRVVRSDWPGQDPVVAAAPKGIVDFAAIRREAREEAAGAWDAWAALASAHPTALPRAHFAASHDDRAVAERAYLRQPAVQECAQAAAAGQHPYFTAFVAYLDSVPDDVVLARVVCHS